MSINTKERVIFDLSTREIPELHIIDSKEPRGNKATLPDETLPTMAEEPATICHSSTSNTQSTYTVCNPCWTPQPTFIQPSKNTPTEPEMVKTLFLKTTANSTT